MLTAKEHRRNLDHWPPGDLKDAGLTYLVNQAQDGIDAAWRELIDRFAGLVYYKIKQAGVFGSQVDDAFQLTWLKLAMSLDSIRDPERLAGWLAVTSRNEATNLVRASRRLVPSDQIGDQVSVDPIEDSPYLADDVVGVVSAAVETLNERQRAVVELRYLEDEPRSYEEIADRLGMRRGAIGPTLGRALDRMRSHPSVDSLR